MTWGAPFAIIFAGLARNVVLILYQIFYPSSRDCRTPCVSRKIGCKHALGFASHSLSSSHPPIQRVKYAISKTVVVMAIHNPIRAQRGSFCRSATASRGACGLGGLIS